MLIYDIRPPAKITVDRIPTQGGLYTSKRIIDLRKTVITSGLKHPHKIQMLDAVVNVKYQ